MWASAEKSYDTLPPNSYDKLSVIQLYFRSLPADISIFDKWIKEEIGSHTMKKGTEEDLKKLLQEEFEKIGKIKLLNIKNDKYEVVDEGIISGFDSNNDKTKFGITIKHFFGNKTHTTDFSIISFEKSLDKIGSKYIDPQLKDLQLKKLPIESTKQEAENINLEIGGRKTKRRKSKRRKSKRRKSRRRKSRMI